MKTTVSGRPKNAEDVSRSEWSYPLFSSLRYALKLLHAALREIFDEAAYDRFLAAHQLSNSAASYEHFQQERRTVQERRPRCC
jgi:hypothetical protein